MARAATMLLIFASCAVLATAVYAGGDCSDTLKYKFQFFEHEASEKLVFSPSKQNEKGKLGTGYVYDNKATKDWTENSQFYGYVGGMYYYTAEDKTQDLATIYFADINEKGGTFANAEIHLRGVWNLDKNGEDMYTQELSIVGGKGGLSGAYGTVVFTKVSDKVWLVQGLILVDKSHCNNIPNDGHIAQVIGA